MEQVHKFNRREFNEDGTNEKDGKFFLELLQVWEEEFHFRFPPLYCNRLYANASSMILIKNCLNVEENEDCGFELIDGEVNLDISDEIDRFSKRIIIYGLGSRIPENEDEPIWLILDEDVADGRIILKYIPDNDDDDDNSDVPVPSEKIAAKLKNC